MMSPYCIVMVPVYSSNITFKSNQRSASSKFISSVVVNSCKNCNLYPLRTAATNCDSKVSIVYVSDLVSATVLLILDKRLLQSSIDYHASWLFMKKKFTFEKTLDAITMGPMNFFVYFLVASVTAVKCSNITVAVFGNILDGMPAAFGDFNSDELTDVFVIREDGKTMQIMLAYEQEPLLRPQANLFCRFNNSITSVVPGDFDGDALMDVFVTTINKTDSLTYGYVLWGGMDHLNCSTSSMPVLKMARQPLAIDFNQDMIIDLFGTDENNTRVIWAFPNNRTAPTVHKLYPEDKLPIRRAHANAFLDLNDDFMPDLFVTTNENFEIWHGGKANFTFNRTIELPNKNYGLGQSLFLDVELTGKMDLVLPVCFDEKCHNSTIMIYSDDWHDLQIDFKDQTKNSWGFYKNPGSRYTNVITLRGGDFNMDGYPDLLATLTQNNQEYPRTFLLQNVPCSSNCNKFNRTFEVLWTALNPFYNQTVMGVFYDFYQDGILDVIFVEYDKTRGYQTAAFKNSLDYDTNFVKVMVLTGLTNSNYSITPGNIVKKRRTFGTNLPGPSIAYKTTTQDGKAREAVAAQLSQSAHFSLNLPYTTFGLGRMPNFIDTLTIGLSGRWKEWTQIIPNSQMVVIPSPIFDPTQWKAQLFVTPSKLILLSVGALTATCGFITAIIVALYWKERREDKIERLQEAHRFHFDAM